MGIGKRIKEARERAGLTQEELGKYIGVTGSAITNYEKETSHPKEPVMYALIDALGVDANFLFQDCVNVKKAPSYSDEAMKLAYDFDNRVDDWGRKHLRNTADIEIERYESEQNLIKKNEQQYKTENITSLQEQKIIYLPEPIQSASAGTGQIADDDTAEQVAVYYNKKTAKADYIMRVSGKSMEPEIKSGDRVLVRTQPSVEIGEIGIFIVGGEQYIKVYRGDYLESLNPQYNDIEVDEYSFCCGKVIGVLEPEWIAE